MLPEAVVVESLLDGLLEVEREETVGDFNLDRST